MCSPKVSVLMSVYNNASTVDKSILSIVEQTFKNWEMILINDASTDGSLEKLLAWEERDRRIRAYSNESNMGLASSLNKAFEISAGAYIARMDGDDRAMPDRLMRQVAFLEENPQVAIVSAGCILFDEEGEWGRRSGKPSPQKRDFLWGSQFLHPATVMRREALENAGGYRVCRDTLRTEDYDLFMRMYAKGYCGRNLGEPLLYYYENRKPRRVRFGTRISEAKTRYRGFKALGLMPGGILYVVKPLFVGLLPGKMKRRLQNRRYSTAGGGV